MTSPEYTMVTTSFFLTLHGFTVFLAAVQLSLQLLPRCNSGISGAVGATSAQRESRSKKIWHIWRGYFKFYMKNVQLHTTK